MKLSIGIVGLPNVGKSTLFKLLTKQEVNIANYPFATIDPNVGVVPVPDERLQKLAEMSHSKKIIPAVVEFYDIAGLVKGANKGEGLGNQFLSHIREVNAIVHVVRCFPDGEIVHIEKNVDPIRDIETINTELALKDLETLKKRLNRTESDARSGDKQKAKELEILKRLEEGLNNNIHTMRCDSMPRRKCDFLRGMLTSEAAVRELNLLSIKPQIYLLNGGEDDASEKLREKIGEFGSDHLIINLSSSDDDNIAILVKKAYEVLGLISFFTTGEDETRAWTIKAGTKAREAAGVIHTDFEKKFIRAEVINWEKLLAAGSWSFAKQKGWLRLEGKDYIVEDGDVLEIRHGQ